MLFQNPILPPQEQHLILHNPETKQAHLTDPGLLGLESYPCGDFAANYSHSPLTCQYKQALLLGIV